MKYSSVYPVIGIILAAVLMIAAIFDGLKKIVDVRSAGMLEKLKGRKLGVLAGMEGLYCVEIGLCTWNMAAKGSIFRWAANCWLGILMVCICICLLDIGVYFIKRDVGDEICSVTLSYCTLKDAVKIDLENGNTVYVNLLTEDLIIGYADNDIYIVSKAMEEIEKNGYKKYKKEEIECLRIWNEEKNRDECVKFINNEWIV